eukprot:4939932-Pyramimonas_sp.AAC.1
MHRAPERPQCGEGAQTGTSRWRAFRVITTSWTATSAIPAAQCASHVQAPHYVLHVHPPSSVPCLPAWVEAPT